MSGLFASLSVGRAWEKLTSFIRAFSAHSSPSSMSSSCSSSQDNVEELMKLERTMRCIKAALHDAEVHWNIREEATKLKLEELKEVAYDAEDVVEEYEYEVSRCKVEALDLERCACVNNTNKRKRQEQSEAYPEDVAVVAVPKELIHRARKITEGFNHIIDLSDRLTLSENDGERRITHDISDLRHTSSFVVEKSILGRDKDRDKIVEKLLSDGGKNFESPLSVIAIVGMGGLGKTTLAQLVYNSPRVRQSFDKHAWVCVSTPFSVSTITRNIINSLIRGTCEYTELADLQRKFAYEIKDKKVLLVLDDRFVKL
ncbi:hypothetical protein EJB05_34724 [Eragrostis curvula]|uniref:NB-ARC domain-containing protein n=1 Tax=Eragrostis curvula TaxID=38414 RepID=A0A5J9U568_9POAL|nr:hypothetical protein EJB05_34724 [Eragrostis curvula]